MGNVVPRICTSICGGDELSIDHARIYRDNRSMTSEIVLKIRDDTGSVSDVTPPKQNTVDVEHHKGSIARSITLDSTDVGGVSVNGVEVEAPVVPEPQVVRGRRAISREQSTCPDPPMRRRGSVTVRLEDIQGEWVNSIGAKISCQGDRVTLNGMPLASGIELDGDRVVGIGPMWKLQRRDSFGNLEWLEGMRSIHWARQPKADWWQGSTQPKDGETFEGDGGNSDKREVQEMNQLISEWREPKMAVVKPKLVVPDFTNRGETGISVEHCHYIAVCFGEEGFIKREGNVGHDIPVLVRESHATDTGRDSVAGWKEKVKKEHGLPEPDVDNEPEFFTSLGNGHFYQALNLYRTGHKNIYNNTCYQISEANLEDAVNNGVNSLILRTDTPLKVRATVSKLLNSKREYRWDVAEDGNVILDTFTENTEEVSQFVALSKELDAVELNCLVRAHLGIQDSERVGR